MEKDRYEANKPHYISGMFCFVASFLFLGYFLYIIPTILFDLSYNLHNSHFVLLEDLRTVFGVSSNLGNIIVCTSYLIISLVFLVLAIYFTNRIEKNDFDADYDDPKVIPWHKKHESLLLSLKLAGFIAIIYLILM